jgi:NAD(P)-dependent dehydrogenase (short-subunit alcohol dehydrogenase family)
LATCELLSEEGWDLVPIDIVPSPHPASLQVDIADAGALASALASIDRVDALVNNAAVQLHASLPQTSITDWDTVIATNLRAAFVAAQVLLEPLAASRGAIVNVASVHATASSPSTSAYAAAKGGLTAFTRAAAVELGDRGIRVNAVSPGAVDTPALRRGDPSDEEAFIASVADRTPLKRVGQPADIAHAIHFLADDTRSGFITGHTLVVDGGVLVRLSSE